MAVGDAAVAAGFTLVDGATTDAKDIDLELNRSRDYAAEGKNAAAAVDTKINSMLLRGGVQGGSTDGNGVQVIPIPTAIVTSGRSLKFIVVTPTRQVSDTLSAIATPIVWDLPPYAPGKTGIQIRWRREDTHLWLAGNPVSLEYLMGA